jgi:Golgi phosphoprotein 3 (GPP34)
VTNRAWARRRAVGQARADGADRRHCGVCRLAQSGRLTITDIAPTDDPELHSALAKLQTLEGKKIKFLVSKMSGKRITKGLERRLLERLATAGVLRLERRRFLGNFPGTTWPSNDTSSEEGVRERLHTALVAGLTPTERTVALIGFLQATGLLTKVVPSEDKKSRRRRARELTAGDWAARAVKQAIEEVAAAAAAAAGAGVAAGGGS